MLGLTGYRSNYVVAFPLSGMAFMGAIFLYKFWSRKSEKAIDQDTLETLIGAQALRESRAVRVTADGRRFAETVGVTGFSVEL